MKHGYLYLLVLSLVIWGMGSPLSWADSEALTNSNTSRNQFHRNRMGQCSTSSIDCSPRTFDSTATTLTSGPQSLQRIGAAATGEIRCVSGFDTADGDSPGLIPASGNQLCLTTAGPIWAGGARNMDAGACPTPKTRFCNQFFIFTGFPRIPTGADTQFGVGAKASNGLDIGGTGNDNFVPKGASTGLIDLTFRQDFKDTQTVGAGSDCGNFDSNCRSSFKINWSAPKPAACGACPGTIVGNKFHSEATFGGAGGAFDGRKHVMDFGHTQRWSSGITGNEGSTATGRGNGDRMQHFEISFHIEATTDIDGNFLGVSPTSSYRIMLGSLSGTDVDSTAAVSQEFLEQGTFTTTVSGITPGTPLATDVPSISVTLTPGAGGGFGCQHDSNGTACIDRTFPVFLP